ncbi:GDSL esterase/lipase EXL3-like [Apium graveolens]|uniref:GDSL esterase/lipase EXL3-like n=1 Tax=Apium graveolens TaxID=4045 RepID=UPI003D78E5E0
MKNVGSMWFIVYIIVISEVSEALVNLPPNVTFTTIIAFGDSNVDQGMNNNINTIAKCNFPPYGSDFMGGIPTGRFCNAKTPPDLIVVAALVYSLIIKLLICVDLHSNKLENTFFLIFSGEELGIKDLVPAYLDPNLQTTDLLTGVSFASGASGYDPQTPQIAAVLSLPDQLEMFKEYISKLKALVGEESANYIIANSIYFVVAGTDDLLNTYFILGARRLHYDVPSYADFVELYNLGARRVAVFGAPPIGCVPSQRTLAGGIKQRLFYIDIYNPLLDLIKNPQNYDLEVVDRGCCGTGVLEVSVLCNKFSSTCPDHTKFLLENISTDFF